MRIENLSKRTHIRRTGPSSAAGTVRGILLPAVLAILLTACGSGEKSVAITVEGSPTGAGVLSFLGYDINVYQDEAHNPCGDCADQPVHLYKGAGEEEMVQAICDAVGREDGAWEVEKASGDQVVLKRKESGAESADTPGSDDNGLDAPPGVTISDDRGHSCIGSKTEAKDGEHTIVNLSGDKVSVPEEAERIAAVYGPSYESLYVLGQQDKIVVCADVQQETFPWAKVIFKEMRDTPFLENVHSAVNVEKLMTYKPDLVFSFPRPNELKALRSAGIAAVPGEVTRKLTDVPRELMVYANAAGGKAAEKARAYKEYFDEKHSRILSRTEDLGEKDRPKVYYVGIDFLTTYGGESDIPDLIETAGGTAVTKDLKAGNHTEVTFEQLAAWNPDYIFLDHGGMNEGKTLEELQEEIYGEERYGGITAVKNREVHPVPTGVFYWDMGLQKILLLEYVAKTIHPELFEDIDMVHEVQEFYQKFYRYELTEEQARKILGRKNP